MTTNESVRAMGVRDGRYGLNRFAGVPSEHQADYDAGYAAGERNPVDTIVRHACDTPGRYRTT